MISFTPALCQETTIVLPTSLSAGKDTHLVRFKASFSSRAEYEQAKRDHVRVEMWTNLTTVGGPSDGSWRALAFDYAEHPDAAAEVASSADVISFLVDEQDGPGEREAAVFLDIHVPSEIFSNWEHPRYSFTYRLVYQSGHVEWLGAFGYDGVLAFEPKDPRVDFKEDSHISTTGGGYIVESELNHATGVGKLSSDLVWERWSFGGNGPSFSRSHITSPSGCIILTPFPAPGSHNFTPEALQPMILTAGQDGASLSISDSGDITFHPGTEAPYNPAGFTSVGSRMLAMGKDSNVLDYDAKSDTMIVTSTTASGEAQTTPVALSFVPFGPRPQDTSHFDVTVDSQKLASVFPGSDIVLYQKTPARKFKVLSGSDWYQGKSVTIRVQASGDQVFVAPLHDITPQVDSTDVWHVAVVSPHTSAKIVKEVNEIAVPVVSAFPTPPPSPPLRTYILETPLEATPSIESVLASIPEEDATEVPEDTMSDAPSPTITPSSSAGVPRTFKEALLSPSSSIFDVPRYITPHLFEAYPNRRKTGITFSPAASLHTLLQINVISLIYVVFGRVFGMLAFVLALFGIKVSVPAMPSMESRTMEEVSVYEEDDEQLQEEIVHPSSTFSSMNDREHEDEDTVIGSDDERTPLSSPSPSKAAVPTFITETETSPAPAVTRTSTALAVRLPSEGTGVSLLVCPPSSANLDAVYDQVQIAVDGKTISGCDFKVIWISNRGEPPAYITELRATGEGPFGRELKIAISA
ncbi:hypothetical protein BXZ70DRAFT_152592 [Cristinia sonorae]|uniref:Uncharacterized protein n=1 Tax=Cristinia sonorae TaxID=1940300 RepID=A0A8K0UN86_9AGAR|nr:hypothetical protein BXZ70DRAFT_152592 [Cristinia sonorae]